MNEGILGAIANPQLADVAGALQYRKSRMDEDEAKRKELRMNQLIAQAIPNMAEDSPIRKIFEEDPKTGAMLSKMMGIPLNNGEAWEKLRGNVAQLHSLAKADPRMAIERANAIKAENDRLGVIDEPLNKWVGGVNSAMEKGDQDGVITLFNTLGVMNDTFNPEKVKEGFSLSEGQTRYDSEGRVIASVAKTYNPNAPENRPTANAQDLATYKAMKRAGDPDAEGFGRSIGIVSKEGEKLSPFAEKAIADASDAANVSRSSAARYSTLADNMRNASGMGGGLKATWGEWLKEQTGNQDELTALRKEALGITNSEAIASLPPGPATDRDIEMAKAPFPTEKSDPKYVADWLGAVSRLQQKKAEYAEFKAEFISKNGTVRGDGKSLSSAWKESQKSAQPAAGRFKIEVSD
jgi:hypothetical protein